MADTFTFVMGSRSTLMRRRSLAGGAGSEGGGRRRSLGKRMCLVTHALVLVEQALLANNILDVNRDHLAMGARGYSQTTR